MKRILLHLIGIAISVSVYAQDARKLPKVVLPIFRKDTINLAKSGGVGNGYFLNTNALYSAINKLSARGVATLNIGASDITLISLTVENRYGFENLGAIAIECPIDATGKKIIGRGGHQMALRTMNGATKLRAIDCHFKSFGGDTVSPWEVNNGMWYFKDCDMEGAVDLFCPRGWSWAENCKFLVHGGTAAIWHDGSKHEDSKTILVNCHFSGFDGFKLGRYHRDAQFFLIDCVFAANMKDSAIYQVPTNNIIQWGYRVYYANCKRLAEPQFNWYSDNLPAGLVKNDITLDWLFKNNWRPSIL